jgi:hypothetical protein
VQKSGCLALQVEPGEPDKNSVTIDGNNPDVDLFRRQERWGTERLVAHLRRALHALPTPNPRYRWIRRCPSVTCTLPLTRTIKQTELFPGARDNKAELFPRARNVPKCVMAGLLPRRKGPPCVSITIRRRGKPLILQQLVEQPRIVSAASLRLAKGAGLSLDSTGFRAGPRGPCLSVRTHA